MLESFKTDDLLADLNIKKAEIDAHSRLYTETYDAYREIVGDLDLMEAKLAFVGGLMRQQMDLVLPETGDVEKDALAILFAETSPVGVVKNILWLTTAPMAASMVANFAVYMNMASGTGKVAKFAKASKAFKLVRFAKFTGPVALALEAVMLVWNEAQARIVNDDLRAVIAEANAASKQAGREVEKLEAAKASAFNQRRDLLAEAGVGTVPAYVEKLNLAIVDLGRQKVAMSVGRKMLRAGLEHSVILTLVDGMTEDLLSSIAARLKAEVLIAGGSTLPRVATETDLTEAQVSEISTVVNARDAYVRGMEEEAILEQIGIPQGTYDEIEEMLDPKLSDSWEEIEGDLALDTLANALILRADALHDLRAELEAKTQLAAGADIGDLAAQHGKERNEIAAWASALPLQREHARTLKQVKDADLSDIASECRLPLAMVEAI